MYASFQEIDVFFVYLCVFPRIRLIFCYLEYAKKYLFLFALLPTFFCYYNNTSLLVGNYYYVLVG